MVQTFIIFLSSYPSIYQNRYFFNYDALKMSMINTDLLLLFPQTSKKEIIKYCAPIYISHAASLPYSEITNQAVANPFPLSYVIV